jgi:hypothetical protein
VTTQPDWSLIDSQGPPDDIPTPQTPIFEESESLFPDASLEVDGIQEVRP